MARADVRVRDRPGLHRAERPAKARLWWRPANERLWAALEADGFSTFGVLQDVRGGIYDIDLMLGYEVTRSADLVLGARLLGGGADVQSREIYNWANFVALTAGARFRLDELL